MLKLNFQHHKLISHIAKFGKSGTKTKPPGVYIYNNALPELVESGYVEVENGLMKLSEKGNKVGYDKRGKIPIYIDEYKNCHSERDKAELEKLMTEDLVISQKEVSNILNENYYTIHFRGFILKYGPELAWQCLDEKNWEIRYVDELLSKAKKTAQETSSSIEETFQILYDDFVKNHAEIKSKRGRVSFKKLRDAADSPEVKSPKVPQSGSLKMIFDKFQEILSEELKNVDTIEKDKIEMDFRVDADNLLRLYKSRIQRIQKHGIRLPEAVKFSRKKIVEACKLLEIKPPKEGTPPNMEEARRKFRKRAGIYHPDRNPGNPHTTKLYVETNQAYELLTKYAETVTVKER